MKEYENKKKEDYFFFILLFEKKNKKTLGLLNHRRNKYIKQRDHHSIFLVLRKKEGW